MDQQFEAQLGKGQTTRSQTETGSMRAQEMKEQTSNIGRIKGNRATEQRRKTESVTI